MKRILIAMIALMVGTFPLAAKEKNAKEMERLQNAGDTLEGILKLPDGIPKDLLDKAECVIIFPSVKKGAFGIGASYGRGAMTCRTGENFTGGWSAPALYALEGLNI